MITQGGVAALQCLAMRYLTGAAYVDEHGEPRGSHAAVEVEVLEPEEQLRVGRHAGVEHGARHQGRPPGAHVDRGELAREPPAGHDVDGVARAGDEAPAEGDHRTRRRNVEVGGGACPHPVEQARHPGSGQVQQRHVVFAQVRPRDGGVGEGLLHAPQEPTGWTVVGDAHHAHALLEGRVVESALPVDHDHHMVRGETLDLEQ